MHDQWSTITNSFKNRRENNQSCDYKQLYIDCKKNVQIFINHVDTQLSKILKNHDCQKKMLKNEIENLKMQLKIHNNSFLTSAQSSNGHGEIFQKQKRSSSQTKLYKQDDCSKDVLDSAFSQISRNPSKSIVCSDKKKSVDRPPLAEKSLNFGQRNAEQKQNQQLIFNKSFAQLDFVNIKNAHAPKRDKRFKQKKTFENIENVKDFLKDIRGKLSNGSQNNKNDTRSSKQSMVNIISPDLFKTSVK